MRKDVIDHCAVHGGNAFLLCPFIATEYVATLYMNNAENTPKHNYVIKNYLRSNKRLNIILCEDSDSR